MPINPIKKVGLIGCGRMGRCMLEGMLAKGYSVVVYDKFPTAAQSASALGAQAVPTPKEVAEQASVILMSLPSPVQLEDVLFGEGRVGWRPLPLTMWSSTPAL